uniref:GDT1 family protein n=1 Tax=Opuntia streptacantha TaxID=393608 RepID=A0A7C9E7Z8_OPUST
MKTMTLSHSHTGFNFRCFNLPSSSPNSLLSRRLKNRGTFSNSSHQYRALKNWHKVLQVRRWGHLGHTAWHDSNDFECKIHNCQSQYKTAELMGDDSELGVSFLPTSNLHTPDECKAASEIAGLDTSVQQLFKFAFLFGSLTLQETEQALAASDFVNQFQSTSFFGDLSDISTGFASAFLLIFFSELGDKTFFIAALLAARNSAAVVFAGTFGALAVMTIVSVILGRTFHYIDGILPFSFGGTDLPIDDIAAVGLLVYFGVTTLIDASSSDSQKAEDEQKEVLTFLMPSLLGCMEMERGYNAEETSLCFKPGRAGSFRILWKWCRHLSCC